MKYLTSRSAFFVSAFVSLSFLAAGLSPAAHSFDELQRPDKSKPNLQKPQQPREDEKDDSPIRLGTDLVLLDVTVLDPSNRPVMDLKRDEFAVMEDKVPQKIEFFSRDQVPVSLVYAIDTSGSMRPKLDTVVKARSIWRSKVDRAMKWP